ncbi:MAG TPA: GlsB/YeaQ/YmgE family stress response membrane protein [Ignavibacteriaceae bacterium]|nr:GlsB/YeaQ/YmgE family stress response membrane protein [Ignavibacteriaceae bacterium]
MSFLEIIILLIIAGISGSIGQALVGFSSGGCFLSIAVGFIGALIGTWLANKMNLPELFVINVGEVSFPVVWAIIGAVVFTAILSLITPRRRI